MVSRMSPLLTAVSM